MLWSPSCGLAWLGCVALMFRSEAGRARPPRAPREAGQPGPPTCSAPPTLPQGSLLLPAWPEAWASRKPRGGGGRGCCGRRGRASRRGRPPPQGASGPQDSPSRGAGRGPGWAAGTAGPAGKKGGGASGEGTYQQAALLRPQGARLDSGNDRRWGGVPASACPGPPLLSPISHLLPAPPPESSPSPCSWFPGAPLPGRFCSHRYSRGGLLTAGQGWGRGSCALVQPVEGQERSSPAPPNLTISSDAFPARPEVGTRHGPRLSSLKAAPHLPWEGGALGRARSGRVLPRQVDGIFT